MENRVKLSKRFIDSVQAPEALEKRYADKPNKRESSWEGDRSSLHSHIRPLIGKRIASSLVPADLAKGSG